VESGEFFELESFNHGLSTGAKARINFALYAALKRRSSTVFYKSLMVRKAFERRSSTAFYKSLMVR
jgi:hypothetical protein